MITNEDKIINYPNSIETRVALLEMSMINLNQTLIRLETKMDKGFDEFQSDLIRFETKMDKGFAESKSDMKEMRATMKSDFRWLLTLIIGLAGIMAHGFHWF